MNLCCNKGRRSQRQLPINPSDNFTTSEISIDRKPAEKAKCGGSAKVRPGFALLENYLKVLKEAIEGWNVSARVKQCMKVRQRMKAT